ncbi:uncharacterized protein OCT59_000410 [Rhizophagus irregularis]|uniref:Reverse transcriptase zinc-binding domain-containing protein n=1 Tax=Rhizophagus irregularis (strain DAOM 181602 / DAOM 197198 / MUCL 43194) TaxID=747089 RepID=U9UT66_RHIID|nr:hypothetical protein OCT59_000410 [Rhizophagus irregularis]GBC47903.1 ribonuclease H-like domain-containing protein [Rhizophagus irregularis DAOM 181602=DAOM 197198]
MTYDSFDHPTSKQHTKFTSWKLKASTQQLPTLDIMNRKFLDIMNGLTTCFLCNEETESNNYIWQCSKTLSLLKPIFDNHAIKLHAILTEHADSPPCIWQDSIRFCQLFSWTRDQQTNVTHHQILLTFLLNYIPQKLLVSFQATIKSKKKIKRLLLNFVHDLHVDIYTTIWKLRCLYFKEWKVHNNITRKSFTSYR